MALTFHTLKPNKGAHTQSFRVGRGEGTGRGKTAGKGTKGQRSRTGGRKGLKLKGIKQMVLGFPKLRGFTSKFEKAEAVQLPKLVAAFTSAQKIDLVELKAKHLVGKACSRAKIVGTAEVIKPYVFVNIQASATAKAAIEKAGGSFSKMKSPKKEKAKADSKAKAAALKAKHKK